MSIEAQALKTLHHIERYLDNMFFLRGERETFAAQEAQWIIFFASKAVRGGGLFLPKHSCSRCNIYSYANLKDLHAERNHRDNNGNRAS